MKVRNMISSNGNEVANQFVVEDATIQLPENTYRGEAFQSYKSVVAFKAYECGNTGNCYKVFLDENYWNYSTTTGKYRNQFLNETKKETEAKIKSGVYKLVDLNT